MKKLMTAVLALVLLMALSSTALAYTGDITTCNAKAKVVYLQPSDLLHGDVTGDYNAVLEKGTRVYQRASASAKSTKIKKACEVNVCAVSGDWALVRTTGSYNLFAFVKVSKLTNITAR